MKYKFSLRHKVLFKWGRNDTIDEIPVHKEFLNQFKDGKVYDESEFEIKERLINSGGFEKGPPVIEKFAIPKQKVDDTELWNEIIDESICWFHDANDSRTREEFIIYIRKHYTITRK